MAVTAVCWRRTDLKELRFLSIQMKLYM